MSKVLITGATGFLGSYLVEAFIQQGCEVTVLKRSTSDTWRIQPWLSQCQVENIDESSIEKILASQRYDTVIHTACDYGRQGHTAFQITQTNLMFGLEVLQSSVNNNVKFFINTDTLLPADLNAYALSKHQMVDWLKFFSHKIKVVNLKLEHMYGPKDDPTKFVNWLIQQFADNVVRVPLTNGIQQRDFVYITDVVSAFITTYKSIRQLPSYSEFEVGSGTLTPVRDFVTSLKQVYQCKYPECITELGFGDIAMREGELMEIKVDLNPLHALEWRCMTSLDKGLKKLLEER